MRHKKILKKLVDDFRKKYDFYHIEIQVHDYKPNLNAYAIYIQRNKGDIPFKLCNRYFTNKELREFLRNLTEFGDQIRIPL